MMLEIVFSEQCSVSSDATQDIANQLNTEHLTLNTDLLTLVVSKMCHNPALLFGIEGRGFIRPGYKADLVLVRPGAEETVTRESLLYKCGWSPLEGMTFHSRIERVWVNGDDSDAPAAEQLTFSK